MWQSWYEIRACLSNRSGGNVWSSWYAIRRKAKGMLDAPRYWTEFWFRPQTRSSVGELEEKEVARVRSYG